MPGALGTLGIVVAFVVACLAFVVQVVGLVAFRGEARAPRWLDGRTLVPLMVAGVALSVGAMEYAFVTHDFGLAYVADNNATVTPLLYSITGMWSALEGSILLWAFLLAVVTGAFVLVYRRRSADPVARWATAALLGVDAFFLGLIAGPASPFVSTGATAPAQGAGPNSLLQDNPLVAIHPPLIYTGLVLFSVPFAIVVGLLASGRASGAWRSALRRWALCGWASLSVGLVLGAWWSYQVLGWGGFWGWDPVENAALLPWLVGTAYVHSLVLEERRGLLRAWNLALAIGTFALTILATYLTRSGVLQSVHAFSSSTLGPVLLGFLGLTLAVGLGLLAWRGDELRAPVRIDEPVSREGAFVVNNLLFVGFAAVVLLGTVFPLLYQAVRHQAVNVGPPYFDTVAGPAALCVLTLMAVAPVLGWRHADAQVSWRRLRLSAWVGAACVVALVAAGVRGVLPLLAYFLAVLAAGTALRTLAGNVRAARARSEPAWHALTGRTSGGMVVHLGVVLAAVAIVSSTSFATHAEVPLGPGRAATVAGHTIEYLGVRSSSSALREVEAVVVLVDGARFYPALTQYNGRADRVETPAIDSSPLGDDVYLTPDQVGAGAVSGGQVVPGLRPGWIVLGVTVEPLVAWLWAGGILAGVGALLALVPAPRRRRRAAGQLAEPAEPARELEAVVA